jgi:hypothetical protein
MRIVTICFVVIETILKKLCSVFLHHLAQAPTQPLKTQFKNVLITHWYLYVASQTFPNMFQYGSHKCTASVKNSLAHIQPHIKLFSPPNITFGREYITVLLKDKVIFKKKHKWSDIKA